MRILRWLAVMALGAVIVVLCAVVFPRGFIHFFGIDTQQSDNYDFWSGVGPCLITAIGLSTLIAGAWHQVNCHENGCLRIGKHKVDGTPWCTLHMASAKRTLTIEAKLDRLIDLLAEQAENTDLRIAAQVENPELRA